MNATRFLAPSMAALVLSVAPALAGGSDHGSQRVASAADAIAEGTLSKGVRTFELAVTEDGFVPSRVKVKKDEKVRFVITRRTDRTCATEIVIAEHGASASLPLGKAVSVEFTPKRSGETRYTCGMGHVAGVIFVP